MGAAESVAPDVNTEKEVVGVDLGQLQPQPGSVLTPLTLSLNYRFKS